MDSDDSDTAKAKAKAERKAARKAEKKRLAAAGEPVPEKKKKKKKEKATEKNGNSHGKIGIRIYGQTTQIRVPLKNWYLARREMQLSNGCEFVPHWSAQWPH